MLPILQLGPLSIQTAALIVLLAIWAGLSLSERLAPRFNTDANQVYNLVLVGLLAGIAGARIGFILRSPAAFAANPLNVFSPNPAMIHIPSAILAAIIAALIFGQRKKYALWTTLDALSPGFAVFAIGMGAAHLASGDAFGVETHLPWAINLWGALRHPTQLYEVFFSALILYAIFPRHSQNVQIPGVTFLSFIVLSSATRLFLEAYREDSYLILGNIRLAQIIAWIVLAGALWLLGKKISPIEDNYGSNTD